MRRKNLTIQEQLEIKKFVSEGWIKKRGNLVCIARAYSIHKGTVNKVYRRSIRGL